MNSTNLKMQGEEEEYNASMWESVKGGRHIYNSEVRSPIVDGNTFPCYCLVYSILERAISDYVGQSTLGNEQQQIKREVREWFDSNLSYHPDYFTFINTCEILDLDPQIIRNALKNKTEDDLRKPTSGGKLKSSLSRNTAVLKGMLELC